MTAGNAPIPPIDQSITFLYVEDLERSDRFYAGDLGLPLVVDQGGCRIYRMAADAYLGVCERPGRVSPEGILVTIVTDEVDAWHDRLASRGIPVDQAPQQNDTYKVYHAFYRDPDGYVIEVQQFNDPGWAG